MTQRRDELAQRLTAVRGSVLQACSQAGRDPAEVTLVAVSKTWPISDIEALAELGVRDFGENRAEELAAKTAALSASDLRWHFLGQIQSKKAAAVGRAAQAVHSVDRSKIVAPLARGAAAQGCRLPAFVQVSLAELAADAPTGRGGADPGEVLAVAAAIEAEPDLELAGVMALPPRSVDPAAAFARLAEVAGQVQQAYPAARAISAGMSHDFPAAIAAGATHIRIGSAVFGERQAVR